MKMCLRVLSESNKSRFDSYSRQEQCIDHIPYYLSGFSRAHFSDNLSRYSCIRDVWKPALGNWALNNIILVIVDTTAAPALYIVGQ